MSLIIDNEFRQLIPPLLEEEYKQLEQNILAKGKCLNKIILWGRRNLTDAARIELALKKEGLLKDLAKKNLSAAGGDKYGKETPFTKTSTATNEPVNVEKSLAKEAKVSETSLFHYKQIIYKKYSIGIILYLPIEYFQLVCPK